MSLNDLLQAADAKGMFCMHPRSWGDDERMVAVVPEFPAREHSRQGHEQPPEQTVFPCSLHQGLLLQAGQYSGCV